MSLDEAAHSEGLTDVDIEEIYTVYRLATLTGWTIEYIKGLGFFDTEALLQIWDAEQSLIKARARTK